MQPTLSKTGELEVPGSSVSEIHGYMQSVRRQWFVRRTDGWETKPNSTDSGGKLEMPGGEEISLMVSGVSRAQHTEPGRSFFTQFRLYDETILPRGTVFTIIMIDT